MIFVEFQAKKMENVKIYSAFIALWNCRIHFLEIKKKQPLNPGIFPIKKCVLLNKKMLACTIFKKIFFECWIHVFRLFHRIKIPHPFSRSREKYNFQNFSGFNDGLALKNINIYYFMGGFLLLFCFVGIFLRICQTFFFFNLSDFEHTVSCLIVL